MRNNFHSKMIHTAPHVLSFSRMCCCMNFYSIRLRKAVKLFVCVVWLKSKEGGEEAKGVFAVVSIIIKQHIHAVCGYMRIHKRNKKSNFLNDKHVAHRWDCKWIFNNDFNIFEFSIFELLPHNKFHRALPYLKACKTTIIVNFCKHQVSWNNWGAFYKYLHRIRKRKRYRNWVE